MKREDSSFFKLSREKEEWFLHLVFRSVSCHLVVTLGKKLIISLKNCNIRRALQLHCLLYLVAQKRWKIDINANQDAVLMLSSMNMPDKIQRRRTAADELNMRNIFEEYDVICAEVRNLQHDGTIQLQARSEKYGKLDRGQLLAVPCYLVKRRKQHFHQLEQYGVTLVLGCNGFIWVGEHININAEDSMLEDQLNKAPENIDAKTNIFDEGDQTHTELETRQNICRIANAVRVLSILCFSITIENSVFWLLRGRPGDGACQPRGRANLLIYLVISFCRKLEM
ncbi:hypothetical protein Nepgr_020881 [Nepenthes gracilis]|uniref:K Homology domain-containing protein n=1 Tax=Nepenthes gracilis TaxID=150966 RepID=A0AAD3SW42_NEPGR|nr:hypothetical protein Nepgr_020881 [Nepenthes gracilis]